jgi:hypothetical protein
VAFTVAVDLRSIDSAAELHQILMDNLAVQAATPSDVQDFLKKHKLNCSELSARKDSRLVDPRVANLTKESFDKYIGCMMPVQKKRWRPRRRSPRAWLSSWIQHQIISSDFCIEFHFTNQVLVEIIVAVIPTGL